jgi:hypothetical protein
VKRDHVKAGKDKRPAVPYRYCNMALEGIEEYGFSLVELHDRDSFRWGVERAKTRNTWAISELPRDLIAIGKIGDTRSIHFLLELESKGGHPIACILPSDEADSLYGTFSSLKPDNFNSWGNRSWRTEPDRTSWMQPNGSRIVSVGIRNQTIAEKEVQAVVLSGHAPIQKSKSPLGHGFRMWTQWWQTRRQYEILKSSHSLDYPLGILSHLNFKRELV